MKCKASILFMVLVMCLGIGVTGWSLARKRIVDAVRSLRGEVLGILVVVRFSLGSVFWIVKGRRVRSGRRRASPMMATIAASRCPPPGPDDAAGRRGVPG